MNKKLKSIVSVMLATLIIASLFAMPLSASAGNDKKINVNFEKPSDWGSNIYMYYYVEGSNNSDTPAWPGTPMTQTTPNHYTGYIFNQDSVRVIFTDGSKQSPAQSEPGIPVKAHQLLTYQDYKYTVSDYSWIQINQPTSYAMVNQDYHVKIDLSEGNDFSLSFKDQSNQNVTPVSYTRTYKNGTYHYDYTFNFSTTGEQILDVYYYYHSSTGYSGKSFKVDVNDGICAEMMYSSKYDMTIDETFELIFPKIKQFVPKILTEDGTILSPINTKLRTVDGFTHYSMEFRCDTLGQYQKLHLYFQSGIESNPYLFSSGTFVTINAWQNV